MPHSSMDRPGGFHRIFPDRSGWLSGQETAEKSRHGDVDCNV